MEEPGWVMGLGVTKGLLGQVRGRRGPSKAGKAGAPVPEGEGCLAVATITQLRWTVSFLLPDLLPASKGRGPFFELQREQ